MRLFNVLARLVPEPERELWKRVWADEIWACTWRVKPLRYLGAFRDALELRVTDERWVRARERFNGPPAACFVPAIVAILIMAGASGGFQNIRRLLEPMPYRDPSRLVVLRQTTPFSSARFGLPVAKIAAWKNDLILEGVASYAGYRVLGTFGSKREFNAVAVDGDFFRVLGVRAQLGQSFSDIDPRGCGDCVVISDQLWRSALGSDPCVIGKYFKIAGQWQHVIGVLPRKFWFFADSPAVYTLVEHSWFLHAPSSPVFAIARLKPGVTPEQCRTELRGVYVSVPPRLPGRYLEATLVPDLVQDPVYRMLPEIAICLVLILAVMVLVAPRGRFRGVCFLLLKIAAGTLVTVLAGIEFIYSPGMWVTSQPGVGSDTVLLWVLVLGLVFSISWAWHDQRKRCRTCLRVLSMPVQVGARGHVLMEWMSTELVCAEGHGMLWANDDPLESHPKDRWLGLDDSWRDLFAAPNKN